MKTKEGKKITGIRSTIRDMRKADTRGELGWVVFDEELAEVWYTTNSWHTTPHLKYEVENEKELKYYLKKQFNCID